MKSLNPSSAIRHKRRLAIWLIMPAIISLHACGGGGGGSSGGGSGSGGSSSSSSSSVAATAYVGGNEFLVNTGVELDQTAPRATTLNNGNVVINWVTSLGTVGSIPLSEIRAQIVTADGIKSGAEIIASSGTAFSNNSHRHIQPSISRLQSGGFGIVYISNGHITTTPANAATDGPIFAREFSATGTALTDASVPPLTYNYNGQLIGAAGRQRQPQFTTLSDGRLLLSWTEHNLQAMLGGDGDSLSVKAQLFTADADELSPAFIVNTSTTGQQSTPRVAALTNGGFVIVWQDYNGSVSGNLIIKLRAQIYNSTGAKVGSEFLIKDSPGLLQSTPSIAALPNGQFVISWSEATATTSTEDEAYAQIFDATGARIGTIITLATNTAGRQVAPEITGLPNGHFVAIWGDTSGVLGDTDGFGLKGQVFTSAGTRFGSEFLVNTYTSGNQTFPAVTPLNTNGFLVTWVDLSGTLGDSSGTSIKARIFKLN
ncbi:hypothetical protein [Asticcacaulis machinosus]|uniref:Uncharacterized protein n=1 Tax=Asticcacaulis machinosus TaxID=2984211 RepID=A0ABT5HFD7_9CAUL|nr:hypothetical protein [Asticcacaulis machinosus]MDC7674947.1 hypothetical protein [Asticcacaulis machinosus]